MVMAVVKQLVEELDDLLGFGGVEVEQVVEQVSCDEEDVDVCVGWGEDSESKRLDDLVCWRVLMT